MRASGCSLETATSVTASGRAAGARRVAAAMRAVMSWSAIAVSIAATPRAGEDPAVPQNSMLMPKSAIVALSSSVDEIE